MLARAEKRSRQAQKIVEKWKARIASMDREGVAAQQARLWQEVARIQDGAQEMSEQVTERWGVCAPCCWLL